VTIVKKGSLALAVMVAISGFLRLTGSPRSPSAPSATETSKKESPVPRRKISSYPDDLRRTIRAFYGWEEDDFGKLQGLANHWNVPAGRDRLHFVIATLPDPVHTHLALLFDRSIEALEQAAQRNGYTFDRAILPWDRALHAEPSELDKRRQAIEEQMGRESYPGLLIFREGQSRRAARESTEEQELPSGQKAQPHEEPLFVLVVGESPTSGLRKEQFQKALDIMREVREKDSQNDDPLLILGPSFSGSLKSLEQLLQQAAALPTAKETYVYSGSVTDADSIRQFEEQLDSIPVSRGHGHFASFQENDRYLLQQFVDFTCAQGYELGEMAVLSEDETVYGANARQGTQIPNPSQTTDHEITCPQTSKKDSDARSGAQAADSVLFLHFPREISFFRSAYQKATSAQPSPEAQGPARSTLALNLGDTGSDDDSVAPYGVLQSPLSQEAVMLGIVSELQKHHVEFTVLFATDPVDQLFLSRYLRTFYPQGRVVITAPDLLFAREEDALLRGILGLSSYALAPGLSHKLCQQGVSLQARAFEDRLFVSSLSVGTYNAMLGLLSLREQENWAIPGQDQDSISVRKGEKLPAAPYAEYASLPAGSSAKKLSALQTAAAPGQQSCLQYPLLWLTILGRDGFWPIAPLDIEHLRRPAANYARSLEHRVLPLRSGDVDSRRAQPHGIDPCRFGIRRAICHYERAPGHVHRRHRSARPLARICRSYVCQKPAASLEMVLAPHRGLVAAYLVFRRSYAVGFDKTSWPAHGRDRFLGASGSHFFLLAGLRRASQVSHLLAPAGRSFGLRCLSRLAGAPAARRRLLVDVAEPAWRNFGGPPQTQAPGEKGSSFRRLSHQRHRRRETPANGAPVLL
jgi:hypothetical protein